MNHDYVLNLGDTVGRDVIMDDDDTIDHDGIMGYDDIMDYDGVMSHNDIIDYDEIISGRPYEMYGVGFDIVSPERLAHYFRPRSMHFL